MEEHKEKYGYGENSALLDGVNARYMGFGKLSAYDYGLVCEECESMVGSQNRRRLVQRAYPKTLCKTCLDHELSIQREEERNRPQTCSLGHEYRRERNCPYCANRKLLIGFNDFYTRVSELGEQKEVRITEDMNQLFSKSESNHQWECLHGHTFTMPVRRVYYALRMSARVHPICPICTHGQRSHEYTSAPEKALRNRLKKTVLDVASVKMKNALFREAVPNHRFHTIDVFSAYGDWKVLVEYDGAYWHQSEYSFEKDSTKTQMILDASEKHLVVRVREEPLAHIDLQDPRFLQITGSPDTVEEDAGRIERWVMAHTF